MPAANITILGDSRVFDTYYYNSSYEKGYGLDKTFPFLLRRRFFEAGNDLDIVHIPDHFRSGTVQNNILRMALTNPACVILCNGIWETLVNKGHFLEYVERRLKEHSTASGVEMHFTYSGSELVKLFVAGELSNSPAKYAERQRSIISYFLRRRRQAVNISLAKPDATHLDRLHYAGQHQLVDEWDLCLDALNQAVAPVLRDYGAYGLDGHALMQDNGGQSVCLIDQWHFSVSFHSALSDALARLLPEVLKQAAMDVDHISNRYMVPGGGFHDPVAVYGSADDAQRLCLDAPGVEIVVTSEDVGELAASGCRIVVLCGEPYERVEVELELLATLGSDCIVVYPEELITVQNPLPQRRGKEG